MNDNYEMVIAAAIFFIIATVVYPCITGGMNIGKIPAAVLTICVSLLSIIGLRQLLNGPALCLLLPYAAMCLAILAILLLMIISKYLTKAKKKLDKHNDRFKR